MNQLFFVLAACLATFASGSSSAPGPAAGSEHEERMFFAELVLEGPLEAVVIEREGQGTTRLSGELREGERRTLTIPLALRAPLWRESLAGIELPRPEMLGAGPTSAAHLVGVLEEQPLAALEALPPGLRARSLPPAPESTRPNQVKTVLALVLTFFVTLFLRKKPVLFLPVAIAGAFLAARASLATEARSTSSASIVLEGDLASLRFFEVRVADGSLALPFDGLWSEPAGAAIAFELDLEGRGFARAEAARLVGRRVVEVPGSLEPGHNGLGLLVAVWTRTSQGDWKAHPAWPAGAPLGEPDSDLAGPPGWLASGLAPGTGVLLGRREDGSWVRITGFGGS